MNFSEETARQHHSFLHKVNFDLQLVHRHPVLQVTVESIGLLHQQRANRRMSTQMTDHVAEAGTPSLLRGLNVHVFLGDREVLRPRIVAKELKLRRYREASLLLLLAGDAGVDYRPPVGRIDGGGGGFR
jgi:hypothetical protein